MEVGKTCSHQHTHTHIHRVARLLICSVFPSSSPIPIFLFPSLIACRGSKQVLQQAPTLQRLSVTFSAFGSISPAIIGCLFYCDSTTIAAVSLQTRLTAIDAYWEQMGAFCMVTNVKVFGENSGFDNSHPDHSQCHGWECLPCFWDPLVMVSEEWALKQTRHHDLRTQSVASCSDRLKEEEEEEAFVCIYYNVQRNLTLTFNPVLRSSGQLVCRAWGAALGSVSCSRILDQVQWSDGRWKRPSDLLLKTYHECVRCYSKESN